VYFGKIFEIDKPINRNSVLEEFTVKRFAVIQENKWCCVVV